MPISFNLLGPQGSGKGTQAGALITHYDFNHFDLGENLRRIQAEGGPLGDQLVEYVDQGKRVPAGLIAQVTAELLTEADPKKDILFDGILRGLDELEAQRPVFATAQVPLPVIIFLDLDEATAVERLTKRRICVDCRGRFQVLPGENMATACQRCGGHLGARQDDTPEAIRQRLQWYRNDTLPVVDYFRKNGTVIDVDARPTIEAVTYQVISKVDEYYTSRGLIAPKK